MREFHSQTYGQNGCYAWVADVEDKYLRLSTEWSFHVLIDINSHYNWSHCRYRNTAYWKEACAKSESLYRLQTYVGPMRDGRVIKDDAPPAQNIFYTMRCISQILSTIQKSLVVICDVFESVSYLLQRKVFTLFKTLIHSWSEQFQRSIQHFRNMMRNHQVAFCMLFSYKPLGYLIFTPHGFILFYFIVNGWAQWS